MTLDAARIDLRRAFIEGMGYVALSRVRSLETLSLVGINKMALKVSPRAMEIDHQLRRKATADATRFAYLKPKALKRAKQPEPGPNQEWSKKVDKMRQTYPNAFKPWSKADDALLVSLFSTNKPINIEELTVRFGRHAGSIRARLKKHFGDDAILSS